MQRTLLGNSTVDIALRTAAAVLLVTAALLLLLHQPAEAQSNTKAVSNVSVSSPNPGEIAISWDAPSDAADDYRVTWKKSTARWTSYKNDNTVEGGNAFPTGTSHTVSNMEEGTAYKVRVRARYHNSNGKVERSGPWSAAQEFTVSATPTPQPTPTAQPKDTGQKGGVQPPARIGRSTNPPAKPTGLIAGGAHNTVLLSWTNPDDDSITGYQVLRGPNAASLAVLSDDTGDANTSYTDSSVAAETTYYYAIRARNANGLRHPVRHRDGQDSGAAAGARGTRNGPAGPE